MKYFTMKKHENASDAAGRISRHLVADDDGCLYDQRFREHFLSLPMRPRADLAAIEAIAAVRAAAKAMHLGIERWAGKHDLSEGRLDLIFRLRRAPDMQLPLGELADLLQVSPRNVTGLVDHLERDGIVQRVPEPTDRRSMQARLTPQGVAKLDSLLRQAISTQSTLTRGFTKAELVQLRHLALRLLANQLHANPEPAKEDER